MPFLRSENETETLHQTFQRLVANTKINTGGEKLVAEIKVEFAGDALLQVNKHAKCHHYKNYKKYNKSNYKYYVLYTFLNIVFSGNSFNPLLIKNRYDKNGGSKFLNVGYFIYRNGIYFNNTKNVSFKSQ